MSNFKIIQKKLHNFIKKYYTNEIIKGSILFLSFGLLYFIFTLFIEYFLWLKPIYRTILFWLFIVVELILLTKFIFIPISKLFGLKTGISSEQASKIIGKHFTQIDDKLLNILQLHDTHLQENDSKSELLLASIEQKSTEIQPIPFKKAIDFKANKKYIKYLSLPLLIWLLTFLTGNNYIFTKSLDRVVHYQTSYQPPAPFYFQVSNEDLKVIEGKPFDLNIQTIGNIVPQQVKIVLEDKYYLLKNKESKNFTYKFDRIDKPLTFYLEANGIESLAYQIEVVKTPNIQDFEMKLNFPDYTKRTDNKIKNTGNTKVPEGTIITWNLKTRSTDTVNFFTNGLKDSFQKKNKDLFTFSKKIYKEITYQISSSNNDLKDYEKLNYQIETIKDEHPQIKIKTDIDSISRGKARFIGQISDDYGLKKLIVVYNELGSNQKQTQLINIQKIAFEEFFYVFPEGINLLENKTYELFFEVFDNDAVHGSKSVKSKLFYYNQKTKQQINEELLKEQQENFDEINNTNQKREDLNKTLEDFNNKLKNKDEIGWNDKKDLDQYLERQKKYQQMLKENADKLLENLKELDIDENDENLNDKKDALQKRIEELKEIDKNQKLLEELKKLSEKLKKEGLIDKLDKLTEQNKQQNRSLERILELTKRFYVEKKFVEISKNLEKLSKEQEKLSNNKDKNNSINQKRLNDQFDSIQKDFNELSKQNKNLKQPMSIPRSENEEKQIDNEMEQAKENLKKNENINNSKSKSNAVKNQKAAAKKMKELSAKMNSAMQQMEMESIDENIEDLQQVLDNLLKFSFDQEALMLTFDENAMSIADFSQKLIKQQVLKEYFEHIDDSLYTLSFRLVRLTSRIQNDLTNAHYNIDKSLENISENRIKQGITNQHHTMTAANNLADLLSNILQNLKNQKNSNGQGKGKKGESISLPDIIKKQSDLLKKMQGEQMPGKETGKKPSEQMSGEQYQNYKEQYQLRQALQSLMKKEGNTSGSGKKAEKQMEELERLLLEKGLNKQVIEKMQLLNHELLKLEKASFDKGKEKKRKSDTNKNIYQYRSIDKIDSKSLYFNQDEILIRKSIPLTPYYQQRVNEYFKDN